MSSFKKFILNEAVSIRELYHGTNSGRNNVNVNQFKNGINTNKAHGYGQGHGFYVFCDELSAKKHAFNIVNPQSNITSQADTEGLPMIVSVIGYLHPDNWDIDYENNKKAVFSFLWDHYEKFQDLTFDSGYGQAKFDGKSDKYGFQKIKYEDPEKYTSIGYNHDNPASDTGEATVISNIVKAFAAKDPQVVSAFKTIFFSNLSPGMAIKYIGSNPLKISKMEIFNNNRWEKI